MSTNTHTPYTNVNIFLPYLCFTCMQSYSYTYPPLPPLLQPESSELVKKLIGCLSSTGSVSTDILEQVTPELLSKVEPSLITAALATGNTQVNRVSQLTLYIDCTVQYYIVCIYLQVVEGCVQLRNTVFAEDQDALHKNDFLWLLQALTKVLLIQFMY